MKQYTTEQIRNVAIVGHGGSGKTMLVEHMLYTAGATDRLGSVDAGTSQSDFDSQEVNRHHSVNLSILPLEWHNHKVNLIDVPGFPDFVGELEAACRVVDSVIIVCEAKADLDVGFDLAWEAAERNNLAKCIFINKLERDNADYEGLIETLDRRYGARVVLCELPMGTQANFKGTIDLLKMKVYKGKDRGEEIEEIPAEFADEAAYRREKMMDAAAEGDDALMEEYLGGEPLTDEEIEHGLMLGIKEGRVVPVLLGSAASGLGIALLLDRIVGELPSPVYHPVTWNDKKIPEDPKGPLAAFVFKTTSDPYVGKINYVRVFSGTLKRDMEAWNTNRETKERIHHLYIPHGKGQEETQEVPAGDFAMVAKLNDTHTNDTLSTADQKVELAPTEFPTPVYRVAIEAVAQSDEDKLGTALQKLLEEEPTLRAHREAETHQDILEGMGDIHIESVVSKLKTKYGVNVKVVEAKIPYRETISGTAKAQGRLKRQTGGKGQFGDCWLELQPLQRGEGFTFENKVVGGSIPKNFIPAIEKGVRETLIEGYVAGYPVVDVRAIVYDGSYHDVDSSEQAFKTAAKLAFHNAAEKANPVLLEPVVNITIDVPDDAVGDVMGDLNTRRAQTQGMEPVTAGITRIQAQVPMAHVARYAIDLRSMTKGRGRFATDFSHYAEVPAHEAQPLIAAHQARRKSEED
ncbi:MAG: elongation factor G [Armatimonadota bacterium]